MDLVQRLRDQANSKNRLSGLIQKHHRPLGVLSELAGNVADHVAADAGHFLPRREAVGKFRTVIADTGVLAAPDTEEIKRHGYQCFGSAAGPKSTRGNDRKWIPRSAKDQLRVFTGLSRLPSAWPETSRRLQHPANH